MQFFISLNDRWLAASHVLLCVLLLLYLAALPSCLAFVADIRHHYQHRLSLRKSPRCLPDAGFSSSPSPSSFSSVLLATAKSEAGASVGAAHPATGGVLPGDYDLDSWASLFCSMEQEEYDYDARVEGTLPADLIGTFLNVGPGNMNRGEHSVKSWLDGDGQITAITFRGDGRAHVKTRFVQTQAFVEEKAADRFMYRGQFGTRKVPGPLFGRGGSTITNLEEGMVDEDDSRKDDLGEEQQPSRRKGLFLSQLLPAPLFNAFDMSFKNPSNTKPVYWGGKLLSCFETALPYELDPMSLSTKGEFTFNGRLRSGQPVTSADPRIDQALRDRSGHAFTAHARIDPQRQRLVGWSWKTLIGGLSNLNFNGLEVTFYEFNESFDCVYDPVTIQIQNCPAPPHDWIVTQDFYVWMQYAFTLDLLPCLVGFKGPGECLAPIQGDKGKAFIHLIPRPGGAFAGEDPFLIETAPCFMTHFSHAFQSRSSSSSKRDDRIVAYAAGWGGDVLSNAQKESLFGSVYNVAPDFSKLPIIRLYKFEIDLSTKSAEFHLIEQLKGTFVDFPKVHPTYEMKDARHVWMMACNDIGISSPPQGFVHLDVQNGQVESWHAPSSATQNEEGNEHGGDESQAKGKHVFVGEAVLAPRSTKVSSATGRHKEEEEELDLYLLGFEYDAPTGRRSLCVFDAGAISQGPLFKVHLQPNHNLPWGIHNEFVRNILLSSSS